VKTRDLTHVVRKCIITQNDFYEFFVYYYELSSYTGLRHTWAAESVKLAPKTLFFYRGGVMIIRAVGQ